MGKIQNNNSVRRQLKVSKDKQSNVKTLTKQYKLKVKSLTNIGRFKTLNVLFMINYYQIPLLKILNPE